MQFGETIPDGDKHLEEAIRRSESDPDFPKVQVWMRRAVEAAERKAPLKSRVFGSKARLKLVLHLLDLQAVAYLPLVSDLATQKDFTAILRRWESEAWKYYLGAPPAGIRPASDGSESDSSPIHARIESWITGSFQHLVSLQKGETASGPDSSSGKPADAGMHEAFFIEPTERRAAVDAYIAEVSRKKERKLTRTEFSRSAGYTTLTELQRWQRNDLKHPNKVANRRFTQILGEKPHLK
jgi:hypothetical protein